MYCTIVPAPRSRVVTGDTVRGGAGILKQTDRRLRRVTPGSREPAVGGCRYYNNAAHHIISDNTVTEFRCGCVLNTTEGTAETEVNV